MEEWADWEREERHERNGEDRAQASESGCIKNFTLVATFTGFVLDMFAIVSILSTRIFLPELELPFRVTPVWWVILWILGIWFYLAVLHSYWRPKRSKRSVPSKFSDFVGDIFNFQYPFLFLPFLIFVLLAVWGIVAGVIAIASYLWNLPLPFNLIAFGIIAGLVIGIGRVVGRRGRIYF